MKAAIIDTRSIRIEERPAPQPGPGEVAVAVHYVGICGSDLARFAGRGLPTPPGVFGHEFSGVVAAAGAGVTLGLGQPVSVAPLLTCGQCAFCLGDHEYLCRQRRIFGFEADGAAQEMVCVPARCALPLPDSLGMQDGALVEPLAVAVHAIRQAGSVKDASVTVLGAGAIGLLIAQVAVAGGAGHVVVVDLRPERLRLAVDLGLDVSPVEDVASVARADVLFEATGAPAVTRLFEPLLAPLGAIIAVGRMEDAVIVDLDALLFKEARLITSRYFSRSDFVTALGLAAEGRVALTPLIQTTAAFERLAEDDGRTVMDLAHASVRLLIQMPCAQCTESKQSI